MNKVFYALSWGSIVGSMVMMTIAGYWLLYPYNPTTFNSQPFEILTPRVKVNKPVMFRVNYCKNDSNIPEITRSFVDGVIYVTPSFAGNNADIGCREVIALVNVPETLPPGTYHIVSTYKYKVNPIRTIEITADTEDFEVIK